jgi:hypothetical protein
MKSVPLASNFFARNQIWASGTLGLFISYVENKCQGKMPKSGVDEGSRCQRVLNTRAHDERWVGSNVALLQKVSTGQDKVHINVCSSSYGRGRYGSAY